MRECGLKLVDFGHSFLFDYVTPHAGVWIETMIYSMADGVNLSLPMRECGLKHKFIYGRFFVGRVTPHAGVWIETICSVSIVWFGEVTPHAGVWIETRLKDQCHML